MGLHCHRPARSSEVAFVGAVASACPTRAAHGNVTRREECGCGARRDVNVNGWHEEKGYWYYPEAMECETDDYDQGDFGGY